VNSEREQKVVSTAMGLRPGVERTLQALRVRNRSRNRTVPLSELDAVIDCPPMTSVPAAPEWLLGVAAYKGALLPVVDLAAACGDEGHAAREPGERLLLVDSGVHRVAFSVDEILSRAPDEIPSDEPTIALRALAAKLLVTAPGGNLESAEPTAR
jgi:chemotaxis signal transduction protein